MNEYDKEERYRVVCDDDSSFDFETLEQAEFFVTTMFVERPDKFPMYLCKVIAKYEIVNRDPELRMLPGSE